MTVAMPPGSTVAVIGAGAMGAGIAQIAAVNGHRVQLHDTRLGAGDAAKKGIADTLARQVATGRFTQADADAAVGRIATVSGVIEMTSLFIFTPVMYAAFDGAESVTRASCV